MFETIAVTRRGRILTIALNRPERLNAFDIQLHRELPRALSFVAEDPGSDIVVLTGTGRAFSAGGDLDWQLEAAGQPRMFEATVREARQIVLGILECEKPIVARVNGPAVGLGATIALLCDVIYMAQSAHLSDPHVSVGMVAGDGGALIWPKLIGLARAKEYLFTGDRISADDAARIGLVNHTVADAELDAQVDAFCDRLAAQPQLALRYTKTTLNVALRQLAPAVLDVGLGYESVTNASADHVEALTAFKARRAPRFGSDVS